jgi:hypothetical protein
VTRPDSPENDAFVATPWWLAQRSRQRNPSQRIARTASRMSQNDPAGLK